MKDILNAWEERHNWAVIATGIVLIILSLIFFGFTTNHEQSLEHIKAGHCEVQDIGSAHNHWEICK